MIALIPALFLIGCNGDDDVTWHDDIAPIMAEHCVQCHSAGQIGPFPLDSYEAAAPLSTLISDAVASRTMPPFGVDATGSCNDFDGARLLTDAEIDLVVAWAASESKEGRVAEAPVPASPIHLARQDRSLDMGIDYTPAIAPDDYRCFIVDPGIERDVFVTGYEVEPGEPKSVHHVILYTLDTPEAEAQAIAFDGQDETAGYTCFGSSLVDPLQSRPIAAWAPGTSATVFPEQTGVRINAGRKMVMQLHYWSPDTDNLLPDRTRVHLQVEETIPKEAFVYLIADLSMELQAGVADLGHTFEQPLSGLGLPLGVYVRGVFPHMHRRGRSMHAEILREPQEACLVDVPAWDFNWQQMYFFDQPLYLNPTDTLKISCRYDTSEDTTPVVWGDGTEDEMCLLGVYVTVAR